MKWYDPIKRPPERFVSVLVYLPGDVPGQTVYEGYLAKDGTWCIGGFRLAPGDVVRWADMPAYDPADDADEDESPCCTID